MKLRYMIDCVLRDGKNDVPRYEPVGVWVQGPGPGLDIEMFYIDSQDQKVLERKDEASWVLNRLIEEEVTSVPDNFLAYHHDTRSSYEGAFSEISETDQHSSGSALAGALVLKRFGRMLESSSQTINDPAAAIRDDPKKEA